MEGEERSELNSAVDRLYCRVCDRVFFSPFNLRRHLLTHKKKNAASSVPNRYECTQPGCGACFGRKDNLVRHVRRHHPAEGGGVDHQNAFRCGLCSSCFPSFIQLHRHRKNAHETHHDFREVASAHGRQTTLWRKYFSENTRTTDEALIRDFPQMVALLTALLTDHNYFKVNYTLFVEMFRLDEEGKVVEAEIFPFRGLGFKVHREMDIEGELRRVCGDIDSNVTEFLFQGSGWMVSRPTHLEAEVVQCLPLRGGSGYCKLHVASDRKPRKKGELCIIDRGQGVGDGGCFHLAVARHFLGHDEKVSEQQLEDFVKEDLVVPEKCEKHVSLSDIDKIERANVGLGLAVSVVYEDESGAILPVRAAKEVNAPNHIVLMLFHVRLAGVSTYDMHYALVRDPALMFAQRQQNDDGKVVRTNKVLVCWNCHNTMHTKKAYENHVEFCHKNNCQKIVMPREGDVLSFQSVEKMNAKTFRSAYLLCFDFEALQVPAEKSCSCPQEVIEETKEWESLSREERLDRQAEQMMLEGEVVTEYFENRKRKPASNFAPCKFPRRLNPPKRCKHKTKVLNNQPPFAYSYLLFNRKGKVLEERTYVGQDCAEDFLLHLMRLGDKFLPYLTPGEPIDLSPEQQSRIREESGHDCWICRAPIWSQSDLVLDHDHVTGLYLGTAHNRCNLARRETLRITCFAHNFSGYDSHFLIRAMESFRGKIDAIPLNTQKFKSLSICGGKFVFVDSCAFLPDSLANLVDMQKNSGNSFSFLSQMHLEEGQKELLLRKGVYPYSSATSEKRLLEMTSLPPIEKFYNDLRGEACSQEDYQHAKRVWESFDCKNMLDYTALYVKTDAFLLAEVVYKFRETIWDTFGLDMCLYFSLPHLAKDIMLKETGAEIELIHDQEMSDLLQRNIRGGLSYVNVRHAERRGEMGGREEDYNSSRQSMMYLDANNLYGHSMKYPLPLRNFRWMTKKEISNFDIEKQITATNGPGYILEVDLEYPKELHLLHNSYPLAPETIEVTWNDLSPYSKNCLRALKGAEERYKAKKLTSTFRKRERYLVHGLNLKLYLQNGLILKKIHRGITFYQEKFLKPFIDNCTEKRMTASSVTEQTLWKLVCNSVYGKFIESYEKRMDCKFNRSKEAAMHRASHPCHKGTLICGEGLSISFLKKKQLRMKQCWAVGFSILELSKHTMARLYYHEILPRLGHENVDIIMSDTDSFLLKVTGYAEHDIMEKLADIMDFSNLDETHPLHDKSRKKIPGYLKNEVPKTVIMEVVALKSKTYAIRFLSGETKNTAKGVVRSVKDRIPFEKFKNCLDRMMKYEVQQYNLRSTNHLNQMMESKKVAFSSFDDKRYLLCPIHSTPYGSWMIDSEKMGGCYFCRKDSV